jgi:hypothetical protein
MNFEVQYLINKMLKKKIREKKNIDLKKNNTIEINSIL